MSKFKVPSWWLTAQQSPTSRVFRLAIAVLALASLGQLFVVVKEYVAPWSVRVWGVRDLPAWERAGILATGFGPELTGFASFLRDLLPESAVIVIPAEKSAGDLRHPNQWQYFLIPRTVRTCVSAEFPDCLAGIDNPLTYVMRVEEFPPPSLVPSGYEYLAFDAELGVYVRSASEE
jgi:hypothetical protein